MISPPVPAEPSIAQVADTWFGRMSRLSNASAQIAGSSTGRWHEQRGLKSACCVWADFNLMRVHLQSSLWIWRVVLVIACVALAFSTANATSIVILRAPHGARIVVAADSEFSFDSGDSIRACKIVQVSRDYWTAVSGVAFDDSTHFDSYRVAVEATSHHEHDLDAIVSEIQAKTMAILPSALREQQKRLGKKKFWLEHAYGLDVHEQALWGVEQGNLRLVYVQFVLHRAPFGGFKISSAIHGCPGDACENTASGFGAFLGHHKLIDKFVLQNSDWPRQDRIDAIARRFVQMEIDSEPDCHCSGPVSVLSTDRSGSASWVGERGPACQPPR